MARLLGEARVSILPDGTRFRPEAEADIKKATAGLSGKIPLQVDTKGYEKAILAAQSRIAAARAADDAAEQRSINARKKMYAGMFDQIQKDESDVAKTQAAAARAQQAAAKAQQDSLNRIAKARSDDTLAQQKQIDARKKMYAGMFDQIQKGESDVSKAQAAAARAQQDSLNRIAKARSADTLAQQKQIDATRDMYSRLFDDIDKRDKIKIGVDGAYSDEQFAKERSKIDFLTKKANIRLGINGDEAEAGAITLREKLKASLSDIKAHVRVVQDSSSFSKFRKGFDSFMNSIRNDAERAAHDAGDGSGLKFGGGFISGLGKSALMQNPGITAAVIAGLAALPAAVGAVGVLGGIALGAGLIFGAEKLVKSQIKALTTDLKQQTTILNAKTSSPAVKKSAQEAINQDNAQIAALNKEVGAFQKVNDAVDNLKVAFTNFAITASKPLIKPFADAINRLSDQLNGPLSKSFHDFFAAVAPLVRPVVTALLEIVNGILPGMTSLLNKARAPLSKLFVDFGKIVGLKLGDWFRAATPYIKDSATYFNKLVSALGTAGGLLIKFGGESAKAFGNPALKGFGPLIEHLANDLIKLVKPAFDGWVGVMGPVVRLLLQMLVPILDFLVKNPGYVKALLAVVAAFSLFKRIVLVIEAVRAAMLLLSDNPWAAFITVTVIAVIEIVKHWNTITKFFKKWWPWLAGLAAGTVGLLVVLIIKHWSQIANVTAGIWGHVFGFLKNIWGHIENVFTGAIKSISNWIGNAWNWIKSATSNVWNWIFNFYKNIWVHIFNVFIAALKNIKNWIGDAWNWIKSKTSAIWSAIRDAIHDVWEGIKRVVHDALSWIKDTASNVWNDIKKAAHDIWNAIKKTIHDVWNGIKQVVKDPINVVIRFINTMIGGVDAVLGAIGVHGAHGGPKINKIPGLRTGGKITAGTHDTADDVLVRVSKNETVLSAAHSRMLAPALGKLGVPGYARGGVPMPGNEGYSARDSARFSPVHTAAALIPGFAKGGKTESGAEVESVMLRYMESKIGHPYSETLGRFGPKYFDCSGLVYDAAHAAGLPLPRSDALANLEMEWFSRLPGAYTYHGRSQTQPGDIIGMTGANPDPSPWGGIGHIGMAIANDTMVSALGTREGVTKSNIDKFVVGVSLAGAGGQNIFHNLGSQLLAGLEALGGFAVDGIEDLLGITGIPKPVLDGISSLLGLTAPTKGLGAGWLGDLTGGIDKFALGKVLPWLKNAAFNALKKVFAPQIQAAEDASVLSGPAGGGTGPPSANARQGYQYLLANLFGGHKIAAAGAVASIYGESGWNPFAQGTGGRGLIGWTPPGTISNAAFKGGMRTQLPAIIQFVSRNRDMGAISQMERATSVLEAANIWGKKVERYGINDVHPFGVRLATQIMQGHASGTNGAAPGWAWVGEKGPELIRMRGGEQVLSNHQSTALARRVHTGYASGTGGGIVGFGASTTYGVGSTSGHSYEDYLARLLSGYGITNGGISGNQLLKNGNGAAGLTRLNSLLIPGTKAMVLWEGNNDISAGASAANIIKGYRGVLALAHGKGIGVVGATLQPAGYSGSREKTRQLVNSWIRHAGKFDAVADLDTALRDPAHLNHIAAKYASKAGPAHPGDAGYERVATVVNTALGHILRTSRLNKLVSADQKRIGKLGSHSRDWLLAQAAHYMAKAKGLLAAHDYAGYGGTIAAYNDVEAALNGKPKVFDRGGTLSPGPNLVYNMTGKSEHLVPRDASPAVIQLEFSSAGNSDFDQMMLALLRRYVRVKGGGNVQKAFGRH